MHLATGTVCASGTLSGSVGALLRLFVVVAAADSTLAAKSSVAADGKIEAMVLANGPLRRRPHLLREEERPFEPSSSVSSSSFRSSAALAPKYIASQADVSPVLLQQSPETEFEATRTIPNTTQATFGEELTLCYNFCPKGTCDGWSDMWKEACQDCRECQRANDPCQDECPAGGQCDSEANLHKPECWRCGECRRGGSESCATCLSNGKDYCVLQQGCIERSDPNPCAGGPDDRITDDEVLANLHPERRLGCPKATLEQNNTNTTRTSSRSDGPKQKQKKPKEQKKQMKSKAQASESGPLTSSSEVDINGALAEGGTFGQVGVPSKPKQKPTLKFGTHIGVKPNFMESARGSGWAEVQSGTVMTGLVFKENLMEWAYFTNIRDDSPANVKNRIRTNERYADLECRQETWNFTSAGLFSCQVGYYLSGFFSDCAVQKKQRTVSAIENLSRRNNTSLRNNSSNVSLSSGNLSTTTAEPIQPLDSLDCISAAWCCKPKRLMPPRWGACQTWEAAMTRKEHGVRGAVCSSRTQAIVGIFRDGCDMMSCIRGLRCCDAPDVATCASVKCPRRSVPRMDAPHYCRGHTCVIAECCRGSFGSMGDEKMINALGVMPDTTPARMEVGRPGSVRALAGEMIDRGTLLLYTEGHDSTLREGSRAVREAIAQGIAESISVETHDMEAGLRVSHEAQLPEGAIQIVRLRHNQTGPVAVDFVVHTAPTLEAAAALSREKVSRQLSSPATASRISSLLRVAGLMCIVNQTVAEVKPAMRIERDRIYPTFGDVQGTQDQIFAHPSSGEQRHRQAGGQKGVLKLVTMTPSQISRGPTALWEALAVGIERAMALPTNMSSIRVVNVTDVKGAGRDGSGPVTVEYTLNLPSTTEGLAMGQKARKRLFLRNASTIITSVLADAGFKCAILDVRLGTVQTQTDLTPKKEAKRRVEENAMPMEIDPENDEAQNERSSADEKNAERLREKLRKKAPKTTSDPAQQIKGQTRAMSKLPKGRKAAGRPNGPINSTAKDDLHRSMKVPKRRKGNSTNGSSNSTLSNNTIGNNWTTNVTNTTNNTTNTTTEVVDPADVEAAEAAAEVAADMAAAIAAIASNSKSPKIETLEDVAAASKIKGRVDWEVAEEFESCDAACFRFGMFCSLADMKRIVESNHVNTPNEVDALRIGGLGTGQCYQVTMGTDETKARLLPHVYRGGDCRFHSLDSSEIEGMSCDAVPEERHDRRICACSPIKPPSDVVAMLRKFWIALSIASLFVIICLWQVCCSEDHEFESHSEGEPGLEDSGVDGDDAQKEEGEPGLEDSGVDGDDAQKEEGEPGLKDSEELRDDAQAKELAGMPAGASDVEPQPAKDSPGDTPQ
eukprot:TRINITY_DN2398_c0_g1_i2.p1 TRINITY_DN2398_c0_g1~~TRINITY_DN2398_c0_g1_i2.p1  ORF type:complete len:1356 (-),score=207.67 TRINITY_DN2398_c0_g1_i2:138-4205(-)